MKSKLKFLPILLMLILLVPFLVSAQNTGSNPCVGGGNIGQCVSRIYIWSIGISALLAVGASVWGGYYVMTARGNAAQVQTGKEYIYSALIGMVLLLAAYLILNTINTDLTDFSTTNLNDGPGALPPETQTPGPGQNPNPPAPAQTPAP